MIRIIADSTCDLSEELLKRYDVAILPLHIHLGDREYADGVDLTPEELFRWSDENQTTPKTSAPSPEEAMELFSAKTQEGEELICFSISDFSKFCQALEVIYCVLFTVLFFKVI